MRRERAEREVPMVSKCEGRAVRYHCTYRILRVVVHCVAVVNDMLAGQQVMDHEE